MEPAAFSSSLMLLRYSDPSLPTILTAVIAGVLLLLWLLLSRRSQHDLHKIPGPWKRAVPLLGNMLELLTPDFHRKLLEWSDTYGGICRLRFLTTEVVMVTDPYALGVIMGRGEHAVDKAFKMYTPVNYMCDPHGQPNLLTAPADDKWKAIRKAVAVSFSAQNIKKKYPMVLSRVNQVLVRVAAQGPAASVDVDQAALRVTLDVIGLAGFNHDYRSVERDTPEYTHLLRVLPRCFTEVMLRVVNPLRPLAPRRFKNGEKGAAAYHMFQEEMRLLLKKIQARGPPEEDDLDIGAQLWRVMQQHPEINEDRVLSEIGILFVEGFETTGHTTSWTLYSIATSPGVQERIAEELEGLGLLAKPGAPPPRELDLEDLKRLPFLTAATKEAMRMLPVVSIMGRMATKPTRVGPYRIPAGTVVGTPLFAIHNTVHNWDAPHEYRPERFLDVPVETYVYNSKEQPASSPTSSSSGGGGGLKHSTGDRGKGITFMPFSEGPRNCVGQSLAKLEVLTLLAKLLANFRVELAPEMGGREGVRSRESTHLTLQTAGTKGIRCHLHPRSEHVAAGVLHA